MQKSFSQLVNTRQACREFNDKPLEEKTVLEIVNQAMLCPSACNSQPWKVFAVTSPKSVEVVKEAVQWQEHNKFTDKAKAFICFVEKSASLRADISDKFSNDFFVKYDIGELVAYATLTAESMGVQSCILGWMEKSKITALLNLQEGETCNLIVALGYSDIPVRKKNRKPLDETVAKI